MIPMITQATTAATAIVIVIAIAIIPGHLVIIQASTL